MSVLIASKLAKDMAGEPLLRDVSFKVEARERLTLAGRNGSGKTTLLRMLAGEASVDGGELVLRKGARVALHDQRPPRDRDLTLSDYVTSGRPDLVAVESRLAELEQAMADGAVDPSTLERYAEAQERLEAAGGYLWRSEALATARGLGFGDEDLGRRLDSFSGGELTRASLARALAGDPDLLLLDEPTNHLDIESLEWLEKRLRATEAAVVLVAHDRWFLEAVGTAVLELEAGRSRFFPGTWHTWRREKVAREIAAGRAAGRRRAEIERLERFVARFSAGTRSRQATSRAKKLERIGPAEADPGSERTLALAFKPPERSGRVVFELENGKVAAGERTLLEDAELWLERGEHVSLVGPNGSGKTTLLRALTGGDGLMAGKLRRGHNVTLGYLSQHAEELNEQGSVLEAAACATGLKPHPVRALLGAFLFSGADAEKPVSGLSGGERRRLTLAILVSSGANVLVLDEPTNHLDLESREALEEALRGFQGSLLLVTHDRALLDAVGTRTIAVEHGALRSYAGGWAELLRVRKEREARDGHRPPTSRAEGGGFPARRRPGKNGRATETGGGGNGSHAVEGARPRSKNAAKRIERLEREVAAADRELALVEEELADPSAWTDPERSAASSERHAAAKAEVDRLYAEYETAAG